MKTILLEPVGRNIFSAITLAALKANEQGNDPKLLILPSDHLIKDLKTCNLVLDSANKLCSLNKIVTLE